MVAGLADGPEWGAHELDSPQPEDASGPQVCVDR